MACESPGCSRVSGKFMGHSFCAEHCCCFSSDLVYDPLKCGTCTDFIRSGFQGVKEQSWIRTACAELDRHIRKLRRFALGLEGNRHVKFTKFLDELRRSARAKRLDMDFFLNLSVGEAKADDDEVMSQATTVRSSRASGSHGNPRPGGLALLSPLVRIWHC